FAKSDMIHLQQLATPDYDIVAGLCFAVARNFKSTIGRGKKMDRPVLFAGGVAANAGMVRAFSEVMEASGADFLVPEHFFVLPAAGAALLAQERGAVSEFRGTEKLESHLKMTKYKGEGLAPLLADEEFLVRCSPLSEVHEVEPGRKINAYLGVDIGSISTNVVVIDEDKRVLAKRYLMTAGRPIEAVRRGLREVGGEIGDRVVIKGAGTTGSGRYMIADFIGADIVKNEITAQATAAADIDPAVDTIFEIGGQDSKFISLKNGVVVDFEMNKVCAAGTGSFLEEQAEKLSISVKGEYAECAFKSQNPLKLGERCTVFMENSLMANLGRGAQKDDLLAGLAYSIVQNYINRVVAAKPIGKKVLFQGGVAFNKAVVAAFEKYLGQEIVVPPHHDVTGAIGMALIAKKEFSQRSAAQNTKTRFKGFELSERSYRISSFQCKGCPNVCEINRVKIEGEDDHLYYGGRCEKYDIRRKKAEGHGLQNQNLFKLREELLWKPHLEHSPSPGRPSIGLPYIFYFEDQLPFWSVFFRECGFNVEVSPKTNREIINLGLESVLSEGCFPVKVAHGHIRYLSRKGFDAIFIPSFINMNHRGEEFSSGQACPETQTIPYVAATAIEGLRQKLISPPLDFSRGRDHLFRTLKEAIGRRFGIKGGVLRKAFNEAQEAQAGFERALAEAGRQALSALTQKTVVVMGRSYNAFDPGMNLEIPEKLAALGVPSIPMDFLPLDEVSIAGSWPQVYWRSGQRILKAARFAGENPHLFPVFLGNFSCGPDSFVLKYLKQELEGKKPYLHIEIDEHSADAGALTRLEAFLDSVEGWEKSRGRIQPAAEAFRLSPHAPRKGRHAGRTIFLPRMSDHAFALKAALEHSGARAEVLPPSDSKTLEYGARFVSGKECYPYMVTTGDMLKKVYSGDFRPGESAFFMPSGTGPCRFGQYNVFHKQVLEAIGLSQVPIFAPNQDAGLYEDLGIMGRDFALTAWKGIVAIELLIKCLHETRPYERREGAADGLYAGYLRSIEDAVRGANGRLESVLLQMKEDFAALPRKDTGRRPLVGVVGEIFVRSNRFSNEDLVRKIEALGGEVWLAPVEEWIYYLNLTGMRKARAGGDMRSLMQIALKLFFQKRIEHRFQNPFRGMLKSLPEPETAKILEKARPYVHDSFEGETVLSIGKAVDLAEKGVAGIVNAMPFGCMPGTIVTALMRGVSRDFGVPAISIPYEGTESATTMLQLEAFMDQAKDRAQGRNGH
ncbi:MAG: acyl-CoA dehydratase activase, partial [Nitrospiraceae bacterium]|nr:acyl-CoA dehydratase activase [Nitrospiraceae bacterium]